MTFLCNVVSLIGDGQNFGKKLFSSLFYLQYFCKAFCIEDKQCLNASHRIESEIENSLSRKQSLRHVVDET